ncbi:xanthine dehydrogenase family protein molybdopterin-binding subunit [Oharaeibacter diazotrophicus]|uniref:Xanthine dehydrogenase molybdenum binding subunit apoprotein n=1 Tax=Oharaeibacter diazotrophicus TaxID=1920512 RepID=A0A4V3CWU0_9HYPH|nr:xanthine dehydrogenase family protein molybdopterin-binding subunit [Oharaeibacter diazotrophicus]TDP87688.1 xanthine dehydrogenase molybdenum binding subunit apoprotein [Oharaeibacter diazotrophicus]BBE74729.1 carbon monoxide dehydrogenase large chain [Pleomorphomonas sp. SM30]GLS77111.1 carbon monoxide dehydrogenase [Oharaeibacter diazotrophicus]
MNASAPLKFGIGASVLRREDAPLITGRGRYTSDVTPPGTLHALVLRAAMAHARFTVSGLDDARALPGVRLIWTAEDIADVAGLPCEARPRQVDGTKVEPPEHPVLAKGVVRHVGDPIAFVVADSVAAARDAIEAIAVDYDGLPAVVDTAAALAPDAALVWPERGSNLAFELGSGDAAATDAAFAKAAKVVRLDLVNNRVVANYMETRAAIGEYDPATGRYTLTASTQGGHSIRDLVAKKMLGIDPARLRVVTPDVGGGFGTKTFVYGEYPLVLKAAEALGAPVKWVAERNDHFVIDAHGRDNVTTIELALDADARFLAVRVDLVAAMGAYLHQFGPYIPHGGVSMTPGLYDIGAMHVRVRGVYTNTTPVDAYRGAGRPEAAYAIERIVDLAGRETGLGPLEIRRRNFIRPDQLPYRTLTGRLYDTGEFSGHLDRAVERADLAGFPARRAASAEKGLWRGLGLASYVEACAFPGSEEANLVLNDDGSATLFIGTQTNGQGHATAYAQVIAAHVGLDVSKIETVQGDTDRVRKGEGTGGSRSIPLGAASVEIASKLLAQQIKEIAADRLEASAADIELVEGAARVVGTDRAMTLVEVAAAAPDKEKLEAHGEFVQEECTYPNGTHVCEVEIDPETGVAKVVGYTIVDDFGVTVNPVLLAGQVHGGVVQSVGQALLEHTVYDAEGQLLTATFLDYCMPRADDMAPIAFETRNVPSTTNMLGIKGAGEAGTVGALPAVMNAVVDALDHGCGIRHVDMPATPARLWAAIAAA